MEYLTGSVPALAVAALAASLGFHRDRSFALAIPIAVASYYALFALMSGSGRTLVIEIFAASGFLLLAVVSFKTNRWLIAATMPGHGMFDFLHHLFRSNPGVRNWWPGFYLAFDLLFAGWLAALLVRRSDPSLIAIYPRHSGSPPVARHDALR